MLAVVAAAADAEVVVAAVVVVAADVGVVAAVLWEQAQPKVPVPDTSPTGRSGLSP